jgi:hypothetical protein
LLIIVIVITAGAVNRKITPTVINGGRTVLMYLAGIGTTLAVAGWLTLYAAVCGDQDDADYWAGR